MRVALKYAVFVVSVVVMGQLAKCQLPEAPRPMDRTEKVLLLSDVASRSLDVYSTRQMLNNGYREIVLPRFIADHTPVMAAYSGATVLADWWLARRLEKRGHLKLAHLATMVDIAQDAPWAIHNLYLKRK